MHIHLPDILIALSTALDWVEAKILGVSTNHAKRVAHISVRICEHMGLTRDDVCDMMSCAILHDIALTEYRKSTGYIKTPPRKSMEVRCTSGEQNTRAFPFYGDTRGIILHHHENWNGTGLFGKKGRETSLRAAVLRLADHVDLRLKLGTGSPALVEKAITHARSHSGTLYAPEVVVAFTDVFDADLVHALSDTHIDATLTAFTQGTSPDFTLDDLLKVCALFSVTIDAASPFTAYHSQGIAEKATHFGRTLGFDAEHVTKLTIAAHLHDVGKLAVPAAILEKPSQLSPNEFDVMRTHVEHSEAVLARLHGLEEIALWAYSHHECMDGSGYPHHRHASDLPRECRILACLDVYQALVEDRPYRKGLPHAEAMMILRSMARKGKQDPTVVDELDIAFAQGSSLS